MGHFPSAISENSNKPTPVLLPAPPQN